MLLFLFYGLSSQTSNSGFVIHNPRSVSNISDFIYALNHNDLDKYRHMDYRTIIHFNEGVEVELLSGTEMVEAGLSVDISKVSTGQDRTRNSQFSLDPSGRIVVSVTPLKKGQ